MQLVAVEVLRDGRFEPSRCSHTLVFSHPSHLWLLLPPVSVLVPGGMAAAGETEVPPPPVPFAQDVGRLLSNPCRQGPEGAAGGGGSGGGGGVLLLDSLSQTRSTPLRLTHTLQL